MHKKVLTAAIAASFAAPMAAQAVEGSISGHVNRALFVHNNDDATSVSVENNTSSSTRIRATGSAELMEGNTVGIQFEYQESGTGLGLRHANVWFSGAFGKLTIGQGSEAGDGSAYSDKSGTWGLGHGQHKSQFASLGGYFGSLDAGGRTNNIRYDSPSLGAIGVAVSAQPAGEDNVLSAKVSGGTSMGDSSFSGNISMLMDDVNGTDTIGASMGVALANGFTWSLAWASQTGGAVEPSYVQTTLGYKFGDTSIGLSYYGGSDFVNAGSSSAAIGIGAAQSIPKVGADLYIAAQNYSVDDAAITGSDAETVVTIGSRVKF